MSESSHIPHWWNAYISLLRKTGQKKISATKAGVSWRQVQYRLDRYPDLKEEFDETLELAIDEAELEVYNRAMEGVDEPVIYRGKLQYRTDENGVIERDSNGNPIPLTTRKLCNDLLLAFLRAERPEKWGKKVARDDDSTDREAQLKKIEEIKSKIADRLRVEVGGKGTAVN